MSIKLIPSSADALAKRASISLNELAEGKLPGLQRIVSFYNDTVELGSRHESLTFAVPTLDYFPISRWSENLDINKSQFDLWDSLYNLFLLSQEEDIFTRYEDPESITALMGIPRQDWHIFERILRAGASYFSERYVHPCRVITFNRLNEKKSIYLSDDDWVELKKFQLFVSKSVLDEVDSLFERNISFSNYYHSTGSPAMQGIAIAKSLLSREYANKRRVEISTGEVKVTGMRSPTSQADQIYVSSEIPLSSSPYFHPWFDEYGITFGFKTETQLNFLKKSGYYTGREFSINL
jgi:hypothetical protein